jgi:hypothetical protein
MGLVDTLKWLWDPRTNEQKRYETNPLQRHSQELKIYIKGNETPFERVIEFDDFRMGSLGSYRYDSSDVNEWLRKRAKNGIKLDNVWYPPDSIERIEIGEFRSENIEE